MHKDVIWHLPNFIIVHTVEKFLRKYILNTGANRQGKQRKHCLPYLLYVHLPHLLYV